MESHNDPKHYEEISHPYVSKSAADEALDSFFDEVSKARDKYKIADVQVIAMVSFMRNGKQMRKITGISSLYLGYELNAAQMCQWGLTQAVSRQRKVIEVMAKEMDEQS
jgi:hypothetical protein